ncbi:MAG TPA: hypothetical protein VFE59_23470, partial [Trebonia sp.]|nr:hypothetical protein [Trebonia sp.]
AAAVALFWCYLLQSRTAAVNSDAAGMVLQGWDMMHGNAALHGWFVADVSFSTFEIPIDGLVAVVHGLGPDVAHITAAIVYTLLVLSAALLARGTARGAEGIVRAVLAGGILLAPGYIPGTHVLLLAPDHTGIGVPILLTLLFIDRARERWWAVAGTGLLLVWAQVDDPLATYAAAVPIALVCLVRAALPVVRRRRPGWYDAGLAAAAAVSVGLTRLAVHGISAAGGYQMHSLKVRQSIPVSLWGEQVKLTVQNVLILFGADFWEQPDGIRTAIAVLHLAGFLLALAGLLAGIACLFRSADRITQVLTAGTLVVLVAATFATHMVLLQSAHQIAVVLPFGAVLAGRTVGSWLARRRLSRLALTPVLTAVLAGYLAALGWAAAQPKQQAETQQLADWLVAHHLTDGLAKYWAASSTTLSSGGQVLVVPTADLGKQPYTWVAKGSWYDPAASRATFVVAVPGPGNAYAFPEAGVRQAFGTPAREYRVGQYMIMVWDKNLLLQVSKPGRA